MTATLIEAGLAKEIRAKAGYPVWRKDEAGAAFSLKVLKAGRAMAARFAEASSGLLRQSMTSRAPSRRQYEARSCC